MRKILYLIICLPLLLLAACDVHEWPEGSLPPDTQEPTRIYLRLNYETDMTEWEHLYLGTSVTEQVLGETYDNRQEYGKIRYIIRTYPVTEGNRMQDHVQEFVFTKNIAEGYDYEAVRVRVNQIIEEQKYYKKYNGNSNRVDEVLEAINVPDIYIGNKTKRKPVGKSNGFPNYTGKQNENLAIVYLAKQGKLKKP